MKKDLSKRERQILEAVYQLGQATAAEIREAIDNPPTYTAVRTHLSNLEKKGFLRITSDGVRYIYEPVVPKGEMAEQAMSGVLSTFFDNRLELAVSTLLKSKDRKLPADELDRIAAMIEEARRNA